jgi:hypothetical protein
MTDKKITEMTLECLMNKESYEKYRVRSGSNKKTSNEKEKKFYRKRIYDLTKRMLNPTLECENKPILCDIKYSFDSYVTTCIEYFKMIDKTDILQEDYKSLLDIDCKNEINIDNINTSEQADLLLMRSIKIREPNNLEKLVKRRVLKPANVVIPPQQKDINLKDPILKNKGIRKKKNIINTYDNPEDKTEK